MEADALFDREVTDRIAPGLKVDKKASLEQITRAVSGQKAPGPTAHNPEAPGLNLDLSLTIIKARQLWHRHNRQQKLNSA